MIACNSFLILQSQLKLPTMIILNSWLKNVNSEMLGCTYSYSKDFKYFTAYVTFLAFIDYDFIFAVDPDCDISPR